MIVRRLPASFLSEYQAFVMAEPEPIPGRTHLETFMRVKGLLTIEQQKTLDEVLS